MERTHNSHNAIVSLPFVILLVCPWSTLLVFIFLHSMLSVSLLLTQRVSISGRENESPRKRGVAGMVSSGAGSMDFNINATGWSGRIRITAPVEQTTTCLANGQYTQHWPLTWDLPLCICHLCVLSPLYLSQRLVAFCFCLCVFIACSSG